MTQKEWNEVLQSIKLMQLLAKGLENNHRKKSIILEELRRIKPKIENEIVNQLLTETKK